jgi:hypothetical protein
MSIRSGSAHAALLFLLAFAAAPAWGRGACPVGRIAGSPPIDGRHIFCGAINAHGRATGFHSRPGGENPPTVSNTGKEEPVAGHPGVYHLREFRITQGRRTAIKGISTLYPDNCSRADVVAAVRNAFATGRRDGEAFTGSSGRSCTDRNGRPFRIKGFTGNRGGFHIITAYPEY